MTRSSSRVAAFIRMESRPRHLSGGCGKLSTCGSTGFQRASYLQGARVIFHRLKRKLRLDSPLNSACPILQSHLRNTRSRHFKMLKMPPQFFRPQARCACWLSPTRTTRFGRAEFSPGFSEMLMLSAVLTGLGPASKAPCVRFWPCSNMLSSKFDACPEPVDGPSKVLPPLACMFPRLRRPD